MSQAQQLEYNALNAKLAELVHSIMDLVLPMRHHPALLKSPMSVLAFCHILACFAATVHGQ
jgi:hypothetical protein